MKAALLMLIAGTFLSLPWLKGMVGKAMPPIRRVEVEGCSRIEVEEVKRALLPFLQGRSLLEVDLRGAARSLRSHPWVKDCEFWMLFPDGLRVMVEERRAVALLQWRGSSFLVDEKGRAFTEAHRDEDLPWIRGVAPWNQQEIAHILRLLALIHHHPVFSEGIEGVEGYGDTYVLRTKAGFLVRLESERLQEQLRALRVVWRILSLKGSTPAYILCEGPGRVVAGFGGRSFKASGRGGFGG